MQFLKSLIFNIFLYLGLIAIFILAIPTLFLPEKFTLFFGRFSAKYIIFLLKIILNTKVEFHGLDNLKKVEHYFVASAHQSMFETFALQIPLDSPIFILKKELLKIPIFGWHLKKIGSISIKRNKVTKDNLGFFDEILKLVSTSDRPLIIFPQGTRLLPEDRSSFKKGASRIYEELNIACQPVAINSGYTWPKKGPKKINSNLIISILKPIEAGLNKEIFLKRLENDIYSELDLLN